MSFFTFSFKLCCVPICFSFGAFMSFAVADALKKLHNLEPVHIFLSGASAPYVSVFITSLQDYSLSINTRDVQLQ